MYRNGDRIIFHIDANSAYLSWTAAYKLQQGESLDIREVPSVIGGDPESRHGIVLTKSVPAKKYGIITGESLFSATSKCPNLLIAPPDYNLYLRCSNAMVKILEEYSPQIQRYSVDECFLDCSNMYSDPLEKAFEIKERIKKELGFTVNIGISNNKLLAKMGSDLKKPDRIHTLFPHEIKNKMWPLKVEDLFMVGRATAPKMHKLNIYTIEDLATYDLNILRSVFKSFGDVLYKYANGIDDSKVRKSNYIEAKGIGNSTTTAYDLESIEDALKVLLSLTETAAMRLRNSQNLCSVVCVSIRNNSFMSYSHQRKLYAPSDCTNVIYKNIKEVFCEMWKGDCIRHLGVRLSEFCSSEFYQSSLFEEKNLEKKRALDKTVDELRMKYGSSCVVRSTFINSGMKPLAGGVGDEGYPIMSSIL